MEKWVRVTANMSLGAYEIFEASGDLPEPVWPDYLLRGNPQDRLPRSHRGQCRPPLGAATSGGRVAMAELLACRRPTDPVGGDTACQHEVVPYDNASGPALRQSTRSLADALPARRRSMQALRACAGGAASATAVGHCLTSFPSQKFGRSISSSAPSPARTPSLCAWSHGNCVVVASCAYGGTSSAPRPPTRPAPTCCSSPTTPAQKSVVISLLAGRCPSACWTCSPSSAITPTASPRSAARACSARSPTTAWTASAPSRKTKCAT